MDFAMKICIFEEPEYQNSGWCQKISDSVINEIKNLRIPFELFTAPAMPHPPEEGSFAVIISSSLSYTVNCATRLQKAFAGNLILVSTMMWPSVNLNVNSISSNPIDIMHLIIDYLWIHGKSRIALFGINPQSMNDISKQNGFSLSGGRVRDVFRIEDSLEDCYQRLAARLSDYDAIVCSNDLTAYALLYYLKKRPGGYKEGDPFLISSVSSPLTEYASPTITAIEFDYAKYGAAIRKIINTYLKDPHYFSAVSISVPLNLKVGGTTCFQPCRAPFLPLFDPIDLSRFPSRTNLSANDNSKFYSDPLIREIQLFKRLISAEDRVDVRMIDLLWRDIPVKEICEALFLSESGFKYRFSQIRARYGVRDRKELCYIMNKYKN